MGGRAGHGHSGGGGGRRGSRGGGYGGGPIGGPEIVYVDHVDSCPPGYAAVTYPDGSIACTPVTTSPTPPTMATRRFVAHQGAAGMAKGAGVGLDYAQATGLTADALALLPANPLEVLAIGLGIGILVDRLLLPRLLGRR